MYADSAFLNHATPTFQMFDYVLGGHLSIKRLILIQTWEFDWSEDEWPSNLCFKCLRKIRLAKQVEIVLLLVFCTFHLALAEHSLLLCKLLLNLLVCFIVTLSFLLGACLLLLSCELGLSQFLFSCFYLALVSLINPIIHRLYISLNILIESTEWLVDTRQFFTCDYFVVLFKNPLGTLIFFLFQFLVSEQTASNVN